MSAKFYMRDTLTIQELRILRIAATGPSNKAIGAEMWLQEQTIKFHISNILRKLGVDNRTAAVWRALELGLIDPPGSAAPLPPACPMCRRAL